MKRETPMMDRLKAFTAELEDKNTKLTHTMSDYSSQCNQEIEQLTSQVKVFSAKLLLAESEGDTSSVKEYEGQISKLRASMEDLHKKSERYEGVEIKQIFAEDLPKLKQYAADSKTERRDILAEIERLVAEKQQKIKALQDEIRMLCDERALYPADFEADCIAPIAAYMPGWEHLNPYEPGHIDYALRQQIAHMLFEA